MQLLSPKMKTGGIKVPWGQQQQLESSSPVPSQDQPSLSPAHVVNYIPSAGAASTSVVSLSPEVPRPELAKTCCPQSVTMQHTPAQL